MSLFGRFSYGSTLLVLIALIVSVAGTGSGCIPGTYYTGSSCGAVPAGMWRFYEVAVMIYAAVNIEISCFVALIFGIGCLAHVTIPWFDSFRRRCG